MQNGCNQKVCQPDKPAESSRRAQIIKQRFHPIKITCVSISLKGLGVKKAANEG